MAALQKARTWFGGLSAWRKTVVAIVSLLALGSLYDAATPDHHTESPRYRADRKFCEEYAAEQAAATNGLHSVGGQWWVDRVNDCLLNRD